MLSDCVPADKVEAVRVEKQLHSTIMVGIGINDAFALAAVDVGVGAGGGGACSESEDVDVVILRVGGVGVGVVIVMGERLGGAVELMVDGWFDLGGGRGGRWVGDPLFKKNC